MHILLMHVWTCLSLFWSMLEWLEMVIFAFLGSNLKISMNKYRGFFKVWSISIDWLNKYWYLVTGYRDLTLSIKTCTNNFNFYVSRVVSIETCTPSLESYYPILIFWTSNVVLRHVWDWFLLIVLCNWL